MKNDENKYLNLFIVELTVELCDIDSVQTNIALTKNGNALTILITLNVVASKVGREHRYCLIQMALVLNKKAEKM